jgi:hypothetical protein
VHQILLPYYEKQIVDLALPTSQKILWMIDCWSIHKSAPFLSWVKDNMLGFYSGKLRQQILTYRRDSTTTTEAHVCKGV